MSFFYHASLNLRRERERDGGGDGGGEGEKGEKGEREGREGEMEWCPYFKIVLFSRRLYREVPCYGRIVNCYPALKPAGWL